MKDSCSLSHIGQVRCIVLKHTPETKWPNKKQTVDIFFVNIFKNSLIGESWQESSLTEEFEALCLEQLEEMFKDKACGFYEIVADYFHDSWRCSYEYDEWDSAAEIRNEKIGCIDFKDVLTFGIERVEGEFVELVPENGIYRRSGTSLNLYASNCDNIKAFITALQRLTYSNEYVDFSKMTEGQLFDMAFMMMVGLSDELMQKALSWKITLLNVLQSHLNIFGDEKESRSASLE